VDPQAMNLDTILKSREDAKLIASIEINSESSREVMKMIRFTISVD